MSGLERYYVETAVPNASKHTGLVAGIGESPETPAFLLYREKEPVMVPFKDVATARIHTSSPINQIFFSNKNIDYLQDEIRFYVWEKSDRKHIIDKQSDDDLKIIMRSYYLQYASNNPNDVQGDLDDLNRRVLSYCVGKIMSELQMYLHYRKDIADFPVPLAKPVNANITGTKSAEFKSFF